MNDIIKMVSVWGFCFMHMADALLSPQTAITMYLASSAVALKSVKEVSKENNLEKISMMGVSAALVFAGQMINYTIPGTGSSGHLCGGLLLSAILGPYAGFLAMIVILAIQCLFFADGGLMALGANVWNMAFYGCFVVYFLIYQPIMKTRMNTRMKIIIASVLGCIIALQLGSFSVCLETKLSGITSLPLGSFALIMQPIHLAIGFVEGLITSAILLFINEYRPEVLNIGRENRLSMKKLVAIMAVLVVLTGGVFSLYASGNPDGLEWSLFQEKNMGLNEDDYGVSSSLSDKAGAIVDKTAFLPDYGFADGEGGTSLAGLVGSAIVAAVAALIYAVGKLNRNRTKGNFE